MEALATEIQKYKLPGFTVSRKNAEGDLYTFDTMNADEPIYSS